MAYFSGAPTSLDRRHIGLAERNMLDTYNLATRSALVDLSNNHNGDNLRVNDEDISLTRQLSDAYSRMDSQGAFIVTANSAIPVADSIRGFYDELGQPCPQIGFVKADRANYTRHHYGYERMRSNFENERTRLSSQLDGIDTVCVVEEWVMRGATLTYAAEILRAAGLETILGMRGRWYHNVDPSKVSVEGITSVYRRKMHQIGTKACRAALF